MRLLVLQGGHVRAAAQKLLEPAILAGPPRGMYREDLEPERWQEVAAHAIWLYLAKLEAFGLVLTPSSAARLAELSRLQPRWQLAADERDEFSIWTSGTGDPGYEDEWEVDIAPRKWRELTHWLQKKKQVQRAPFHEDTWRAVCRDRFFHSLRALYELAEEGVWPAARWREALQVWGEDGMLQRSWRYAAPLVLTMPDGVVMEIAGALTRWLEAAASLSDSHKDIFLGLCRRVLNLLDEGSGIRRSDGEPIDRPFFEAINHPIGHVTRALINRWFSGDLRDGGGLPSDIAQLFTRLCDVQAARFRYGRVLLASQLITLFRVDPTWTEQHLLPRFEWASDPAEAKAVWEGFLRSPRVNVSVLIVLKRQFLETVGHYEELGEHAQHLAAFLTYVALERINGYTEEDWRLAVSSLPQEGLQQSAEAVAQALEGAGEQREEYWKNRIQPFWHNVWPKSRKLATPGIAKSLARLSIASGTEFPAALAAIEDWLCPLQFSRDVIRRLRESGICRRFPADALRLLAAIGTEDRWAAAELEKCLNLIVEADASLPQDPSYRRLHEYARRHGG